MGWSAADLEFLRVNYPRKGRDWCAKQLGVPSSTVRAKAWRMQIKARGTSEAWQQKQRDHSQKLTGRKRPEQAKVILALHASGALAKTEAQRAAVSVRSKAWIRENGHPRGALGMKHTDAAKEKMGAAAARHWESLSESEKGAHILKSAIGRVANGTAVRNRAGTTWKSGWREIGGKRKFFRSRWEANYARYLEWLKRLGEIQEWDHEPETFWFEGIKRGCVSYLPDFRVRNKAGELEYHEVKGWMDDRSKTKIKRMALYHPTVKLVVIEKNAYNALKRSVGRLIPGWET